MSKYQNNYLILDKIRQDMNNLNQLLDNLKSKKIRPSNIEKELKIGNGYLSKMVKGYRIMTPDVLNKLLPFYKEKMGVEFEWKEWVDKNYLSIPIGEVDRMYEALKKRVIFIPDENGCWEVDNVKGRFEWDKITEINTPETQNKAQEKIKTKKPTPSTPKEEITVETPKNKPTLRELMEQAEKENKK